MVVGEKKKKKNDAKKCSKNLGKKVCAFCRLSEQH